MSSRSEYAKVFATTKKRARNYAQDGVIEKDGILFCSFCTKGLSNKKSTIDNHLKSELHIRNSQKGRELPRLTISSNDLSSTSFFSKKRRAVEFSEYGLIERDGELICSVCDKEVQNRKSTILNHFKTKLHRENLASNNRIGFHKEGEVQVVQEEVDNEATIESSDEHFTFIPTIQFPESVSASTLNFSCNEETSVTNIHIANLTQTDENMNNCLLCGERNSVALWGTEIDICHSFCLLFSIQEDSYINELEDSVYCQMCVNFMQTHSGVIEQFKKLEKEIDLIQNEIKSRLKKRQNIHLNPQESERTLLNRIFQDLNIKSSQTGDVPAHDVYETPQFIFQNVTNPFDIQIHQPIKINEIKREIQENDDSIQEHSSPNFVPSDSETDDDFEPRGKVMEIQEPQFCTEMKKGKRIDSKVNRRIREFGVYGITVNDGNLYCSFCEKFLSLKKSVVDRHIESISHSTKSEGQILNTPNLNNQTIPKASMSTLKLSQYRKRAQEFADYGVIENQGILLCVVCGNQQLSYKKSTIQKHVVSESHLKNNEMGIATSSEVNNELNSNQVQMDENLHIRTENVKNHIKPPIKHSSQIFPMKFKSYDALAKFNKKINNKRPWELKHLTNGQLKYLKDDALNRNTSVSLIKLEDLTQEELTAAFKSATKKKSRKTTRKFRSLGIKRPPIPTRPLKRGAKPFHCPYENCYHSATSELSIHGHINWKHKNVKGSRHICPICSKTFKTNWSLQVHVDTEHEGNSFTCDVCGKSYRSRIHLDLHKRRYHSENMKNKELCNVCGKSYLFIERHKLEHWEEGEFPCDICNKKHKNSKLLEFHKLRQHAAPDNELVSCKREDCNLKFINAYKLKLHLRSAHREKQYGCSQCPEKFLIPSALLRHIQLRHNESPQFVCEYPGCGKRFKLKYRLKDHEKIHTGDMPYICHVCSMSFRTTSHLKRHLTSHSSERPFICEICGASFKHTAYLMYHVKGVHEGLYKPNKNPVNRRRTNKSN